MLNLKQRGIITLLISASSYFATPIVKCADEKSQLKTIQQSIAEKSESVNKQKKLRSKLLSQLEIEEKNIAAAGRKLRGVLSELKTVEHDINQLNHSVTQLEQQQQQQTTLLSQQLDAAFRLGKYNALQHLLDNQYASRKDRILVLYGYLNETRQKTISDLQQTQTQLIKQKKALIEKQQQKKQVLDEQQRQQTVLAQARTARKTTLTSLESTLKKNQAELAELQRNQQRLQNKIAQAERKARERALREAREAEKVRQRQAQAQAQGQIYQPTQDENELISRNQGLGQVTGNARWPVRGRIAHSFGEPIQGELRWKGIVINVAEGSEVKAVADGRVIMADWLQGYGLVVVVAHGKDDMSLYGYNQTALVDVGNNIKAGQVIALVGDSGERGTPSLYFEIRRKGKAINPLSWLGS